MRLPELPIEYYDEEALHDIGNAIGPMLRVDVNTFMEKRGRFARICVQVDVDKPLVRTIIIGSKMLQVVYKGVSSMCFSCGQLGHRRMDCRYTPQPPLISPESQKVAEEGVLFENGTGEDKTGDVAYGPWTFVTHKKHGLKPKRLETKVFPNGTTSTGQLKLDQEKLNLIDLQLDSPKVLDNHASNRPDYSYRTSSQGSEPTGGMSASHENSPNTFGIDDSTDLSAPTRHDSEVQYMPRKRISKKAPGSGTGLKGVLSGVSKGKNMKKGDVLLARDFSMSKLSKAKPESDLL